MYPRFLAWALKKNERTTGILPNEGPDPRNDIYPSSIITHKPPQVPPFTDDDSDFKEWWFMFKRGQPRFSDANR